MYTPIQYAKDMAELESTDNIIDTLKTGGMIDKDVTKGQFLKFVFSQQFFNPNCMDGPFGKLNDAMMHDKVLNKRLVPDYRMSDVRQRMTEWRDYLTTGPCIERWSEYKQAYKLDGDFFEELVRTENIGFTKDTFRRLPINTFYIDLESCKNISPFVGAYVHIEVDDTPDVGVFVYMLTDGKGNQNGGIIFSHYAVCHFGNEDEIVYYEKDQVDASEFLVRDGKVGELPDEVPLKSVPWDDRRVDIVTAILQVILFLSADSEDIWESSLTKQTYKPRKPGAPVKNKFSELRMWDVGVRYGKAIKLAKEELVRRAEEPGTDTDTDIKSDGKGARKSPRPHLRCAHWQRFHCGEGRTQVRTRWVGPVLVCGGKELPVTIHKVGS